MKLPISPGQYLFITGLIYFVVGMYAIFVDRFTEPEILSMCWILALWAPFILPIGRLVHGAPFWRL